MVIAQQSQICASGPGTGCSNDRIAGVAAEALQVGRGRRLHLIELDQGLTDRQHIEGVRQSRTGHVAQQIR